MPTKRKAGSSPESSTSRKKKKPGSPPRNSASTLDASRGPDGKRALRNVIDYQGYRLSTAYHATYKADERRVSDNGTCDGVVDDKDLAKTLFGVRGQPAEVRYQCLANTRSRIFKCLADRLHKRWLVATGQRLGANGRVRPGGRAVRPDAGHEKRIMEAIRALDRIQVEMLGMGPEIGMRDKALDRAYDVVIRRFKTYVVAARPDGYALLDSATTNSWYDRVADEAVRHAQQVIDDDAVHRANMARLRAAGPVDQISPPALCAEAANADKDPAYSSFLTGLDPGRAQRKARLKANMTRAPRAQTRAQNLDKSTRNSIQAIAQQAARLIAVPQPRTRTTRWNVSTTS